jgi:hypothetical protein
MLKLEIHWITKRLYSVSKITWNFEGNTAQYDNEKKKTKIGAKKNKNLFVFFGINCSCVINLIPSATGCKIPQGPTLLGPFRRWTAAMSLRSRSVKKATATSTGTILIITYIIFHI